MASDVEIQRSGPILSLYSNDVCVALGEIIPFILIDLQTGIIVYANLIAEQLFGYLRGGLLNTPVANLIPPEHRAAFDSFWTAYQKNPVSKTVDDGVAPSLKRDGSTFSARVLFYPRVLVGREKVYAVFTMGE